MPAILRPTVLAPRPSCLILFLPPTSSFRCLAVYLRSSLLNPLGAQPYKLPTIPYLSDLHSRAILASALESCHTTANSLRVYRRDHVCEILMLRDINQKNGISVEARWFTRWQKLYREILEAKEYCCAFWYVDLIRRKRVFNPWLLCYWRECDRPYCSVSNEKHYLKRYIV